MTVAASAAPTPRRLAAGELVLEIDVVDDAAALLRVLTVLRRRGCAIRRVDYRCADRHRPGWLTVTVVPPPRRAHCVARWLETLVEVREVVDA